MHAIHFEVVGEEDYAFVIDINSEGEYHISGGTYTSEKPQSGKLTAEQEADISAAVDVLGTPQDHSPPDDAADAFRCRLTINKESDPLIYPFWEGALQEDSRLLSLVRLLEKI